MCYRLDMRSVELPKIGKLVKKGDQIGVVESVKAASEIYAPVSGEIIEVNNELKNNPSLVNSDPENTGWYMKIKLKNIEELKELMDTNQYKKSI